MGVPKIMNYIPGSNIKYRIEWPQINKGKNLKFNFTIFSHVYNNMYLLHVCIWC